MRIAPASLALFRWTTRPVTLQPIAVSRPRERSGDDCRLQRARSSFLRRVLSSSLRAAALASPAPKGVNVPARPRSAGLLPFAPLCPRHHHRPTARGRPRGAASPPALVRHPPPVRRLAGPPSKPDPHFPIPSATFPHPTPPHAVAVPPLPASSAHLSLASVSQLPPQSPRLPVVRRRPRRRATAVICPLGCSIHEAAEVRGTAATRHYGDHAATGCLLPITGGEARQRRGVP
uniref:Uncharacterized protein n=1 Tax=Oryza nivara TaxID=4536 RepID=A0A0E0FN84_ORYNI